MNQKVFWLQLDVVGSAARVQPGHEAHPGRGAAVLERPLCQGAAHTAAAGHLHVLRRLHPHRPHPS